MAREASVKLGLDIGAFRQSLSEAIKGLRGLSGEETTVKVGVDDTPAQKGLRDSKTRFVKAGDDAGAGFGKAFGDSAERNASGGFDKLSALIGGAIGGFASQAIGNLASGLKEGALRADEFGDSLGVAFRQQGIADVDAEIQKVNDSAVQLANSLGLPSERTKELAVNVATLGGVSGQQAADLTKLSAGLEVFTNGAVKGEAVVKAFSRGIADPEGAAAIENLTKKYPQLAEVLKSNLSPAEKLAQANLTLGDSFAEVEAQQSDAGGALNKITNQFNEAFEKIGTQLLEALAPLANGFVPIVDALIVGLQAVQPVIAAIVDNFDTLGPVLAIVAAGYGAYAIAQNSAKIATIATTIAEWNLNAALAANPATAVIIAITALTAGLVLLSDALSVSAEEALGTAEAEKELIENQITSNKERQKTVKNTKSLAEEYTQLANKSKRTVEEEKKLRSIQGDLDKQYPNLIDQTKSFGENLAGVEEIGKRTTAELGNLDRQATELAARLEKATRNVTFAARNAAIAQLQDLTDRTIGIFGSAELEKAGQKFANAVYNAKNTEDAQKAFAAFSDDVNALGIDAEELNDIYGKANDVLTKTLATFGRQADAAGEVAKAAEETAQAKADGAKEDEKARKAAEALAKANAALAAQQRELDKQREIAATNSIVDETARQKAIAEIDFKYQQLSLEAEQKALQSKGAIRESEEKAIGLRIIAAREATDAKIADIEAKSAADAVKRAEDAERKSSEATAKIAQRRLDDLLAQLKAGDTAIVEQVAAAQRDVIDRSLSDAVDAIVQSTPAFVDGAKAIQRELLAGIINADEAKARTDALRQTILQELLALPADAGNVYAEQIRIAYDDASTRIVEGTRQITDAVNQALADSETPGFIASLGGLQQALERVDYGGIIRRSRDASKQIASNQGDLVNQLLQGETTYQDAVTKFAELEEQKAASTSATLEVIAGVLQATAAQQLDAANQQIGVVEKLRARQDEIATEVVNIEARKNAAIALLRQEDFASAQLYEDAKRKLSEDAKARIDALNAEQTANAERAAKAQSQALENIAASAGAAFAGLITGSEDASEALKSIVGDTVASLIRLYTPAIIAGFQSVVPGPIGFVLGSAAVAALNALLQTALAGFSDGGYTGNVGTSSVAGVVHGQEFVINARDTKRNRALLEHINAGGTIDNFGAVPVNEFAAMRSELQAIRQRLDRIPDMTERRESVDVQLGLDTVLYERQRHRFMARSLRG